MLDTWAQQVRVATLEASQAHSDAVKVETWDWAVSELKRQLAHARKP